MFDGSMTSRPQVHEGALVRLCGLQLFASDPNRVPWYPESSDTYFLHPLFPLSQTSECFVR